MTIRRVGQVVALLQLVGLWGGQAVGADAKRPQGPAPAPLAAQTHEGRTEPMPPSALRVTGTVISPEKKVALMVVLDEQGQAVETAWVTEGATVKGYRLVTIGVDRVFVERDGATFGLALGSAPASLPSVMPDLAEADQHAPRDGPGFLERLGQHPEFNPLLDEIRRSQQPGGDPAEAAERYSELLQKPELQEALRKLWPE